MPTAANRTPSLHASSAARKRCRYRTPRAAGMGAASPALFVRRDKAVDEHLQAEQDPRPLSAITRKLRRPAADGGPARSSRAGSLCDDESLRDESLRAPDAPDMIGSAAIREIIGCCRGAPTRRSWNRGSRSGAPQRARVCALSSIPDTFTCLFASMSWSATVCDAFAVGSRAKLGMRTSEPSER